MKLEEDNRVDVFFGWLWATVAYGMKIKGVSHEVLPCLKQFDQSVFDAI